MLTIYLGALLIGGALVAFSLLSGGDDHDMGEMELDHGVDFEAEHEVEVDAPHDMELDHQGFAQDAWMLFVSFRFWTFFLAFGGLTGTALTVLTGLIAPIVAALAVTVGGISGFTVAKTLRELRKKEVTGHVEEKEFLGRSGKVLLPISKASVGRIRIRVKGRDVDLIAKTDEDVDLAEAEEVIVYDIEEGTAVVTSAKQKLT